MIKTLFLTCLTLLLFAFPGAAQKPEPPARMAVFFIEVVKIENSISDNDWESAQEGGKNIQLLIKELAPAAGETARKPVYQQLASKVRLFQDVLQRRDRSLAFEHLLELEKLFFHTMEFFDYMVYPAFIMINEYVEEAIDAVDSKDYERVIHEMDEIVNIIGTSSAKMAAMGVEKGMQSDFLLHLEAVKAAATNRNLSQLKLELKKMNILSGAFIWIGTRHK